MVVEIRRWKSDKGIALNETLEFVQLATDSQTREKLEKVKDVIKGTINVEEFSYQRPQDSGKGIEVQNQPVRIIKLPEA